MPDVREDDEPTAADALAELGVEPAPPVYANLTFTDLYMKHVGRTEVPVLYHYWAALALLSAAVGDRVWIEKFVGSGKRLIPNLYVLLIGKSGLGKGEACERLGSMVKRVPALDARTYWGKTSGQALADYMGGRPKSKFTEAIPAHPNVFLVNEELGLCVGSGPVAKDFVRYMTGLFIPSPVAFRDGTRTHGLTTIPKHSIVWFAGTTHEWLVDSVTRDAIEGGFFARTFVVTAEPDYNMRIVEPTVPDDYDDMVGELVERLGVLNDIEDYQVVLTDRARSVRAEWYNGRPPPEDDSLAPSWKRADDAILRVATLLALSNWTKLWRKRWLDHPDSEWPTIWVTEQHVLAAQNLVNEAHRNMPALLTLSATTGDKTAQCLTFVRQQVERAGKLGHSVLLRAAAGRAYDKRAIDGAVQMLVEQGYVDREPYRPERGRPGMFYVWRGRRKLRVSMPMPEDDDVLDD